MAALGVVNLPRWTAGFAVKDLFGRRAMDPVSCSVSG
jgi:hypothetical protein